MIYIFPLAIGFSIGSYVGYRVIKAYKRKNAFRIYCDSLEDRIVKISPKISKREDIKSQYGRIIGFISSKNQKIISLEVELLPTPKMLKDAEKEYQKAFKLQMQSYENNVSYYGNFLPGYPPQKPQYNFSYESSVERIGIADCKIMPKKFDYISGQVLKDITNSVKKGGEKRVKRMPRLFKTILYLALVIFVWSVMWDVVIHLNDITSFGIHTFLHK